MISVFKLKVYKNESVNYSRRYIFKKIFETIYFNRIELNSSDYFSLRHMKH